MNITDPIIIPYNFSSEGKSFKYDDFFVENDEPPTCELNCAIRNTCESPSISNMSFS